MFVAVLQLVGGIMDYSADFQPFPASNTLAEVCNLGTPNLVSG